MRHVFNVSQVDVESRVYDVRTKKNNRPREQEGNEIRASRM